MHRTFVYATLSVISHYSTSAGNLIRVVNLTAFITPHLIFHTTSPRPALEFANAFALRDALACGSVPLLFNARRTTEIPVREPEERRLRTTRASNSAPHQAGSCSLVYEAQHAMPAPGRHPRPRGSQVAAAVQRAVVPWLEPRATVPCTAGDRKRAPVGVSGIQRRGPAPPRTHVRADHTMVGPWRISTGNPRSSWAPAVHD